jgi:hypothetical protein
MMTDEPTYVICSLGPLTNDGTQIIGSIEMACEKCSRVMNVAPTGQRAVYTLPAPVVFICTECGMKQMSEDLDAKVMELTIEQKQEIRAHFAARN